MIHKMHIRVYYADTDAEGIVYHANYLVFAEKARAEFLYDRGMSNKDLLDRGIGVVIRQLEMKFKSPAYLEDLLTVETSLDEIGGASLQLTQRVMRGDTELVEIKMTEVFVDTKTLRPVRLPADIKAEYEQYKTKEK